MVVEDCQTLCAKFELCDSATDETDCADACIDDQARSPALIEISTDCVEAASCDEVSSGAYDDCVVERVLEFPVRGLDEAFCSEYAAKTKDCNSGVREDELKGQCVDLVRAFLGDYVTSLGECLSESCEEVQACMDRVADSFHTNVIMPFLVDITTGPDNACCQSEDVCQWANDGFCDCEGAFAWDAGDCGS